MKKRTVVLDSDYGDGAVPPRTMEVESSKEIIVTVLHGGCRVKIERLLNGRLVKEEVQTLVGGDILHMRLRNRLSYEVEIEDGVD